MTPLTVLRLLVPAATLFVMMSLPAAALEPETCFSRQHQGITVNVRQALSRTAATAMNPRLVRSERDCVLACCSEEVKPGSRCNMAVFKATQHTDDDNCLLFHCPTELDCPLMKAQDGINTYNIYKGLTHLPTPRLVTMTTTVQTSTTSAPSAPTTTTQAPPTTTEPPPPIIIITPTPAFTSPPTTTSTTTTTTTAAAATTTTTATTTAAATTTTTTATTTAAAATTTTTTTTTTAATTTGLSPAFDSRKPNKNSKKPNKTIKKGKPHPVSTTSTTASLPVLMVSKEAEPRTMDTSQSHTEPTTTAPTTSITPTPTPTTTTSTTPTTTTDSTTPTTTTDSTMTTTATATATTTTTTTTTTTCTLSPTTTTPPPTESPTTTTAPPSLIIIPKDIFQSDHVLQSGHALQNSSTSQAKAAQGALKSGMVAFMVLGLAVLTLALAVGGRKAMESFDRRHYTRLELNDLHYEI
ncbi:MANSC domain-containing protein 1 [Kryptolebias marmoratus]|uniref:MANSC domain-containing protein 1 n=1 Tax=Kryptolebias marmoratus TaxID=37003 RepID=UPI000D52F1EC|nr:MANSC domain-containing protein 1 [Kryptolebias marmoratus]